MATKTTWLRLLPAMLGLVIGGYSVVPAWAGISFVDMFRNESFTQTGNGNSLSPRGSFLSLRLTSIGSNNYDIVKANYPGWPAPIALVPVDSAHFSNQTGFYLTRAAMDTDFPFGTLTFFATNPSGTDNCSFDYSADAYPSSLPYLTGSNYSDVQGMNAGAPFIFKFSPYTMDPAANQAFVFFTIFDYTSNTIVFDAGFQSSTTTSLTLPANTLLPGRHYGYELIFSARIFVPSDGTNFGAQLGFDLRTTGMFTTATGSEPSKKDAQTAH